MAVMLSCCVPHCRRRAREDGHTSEWICADHWRTTDLLLRHDYRRLRRGAARSRTGVSREDSHRAWEALKRQAIERAAGI